MLAGALQRTGRTARASELVGALARAPRPPMGMALYHLLSGELDAAADWYERSIEQRDPFALVFAATELTQELRQTHRWPKVARLMNLSLRP
jgi:hypothetical protein